jgi:tetratricopeptide (TPR) repeat protein
MTRAWVKERPKDSDAWCALGHALHGKLLAEAQGRGEMDRKLLEESLGANRRALELTPGNSVAWNNLGVAHDMENRQDLAVKAFEHALELRPDYGLAWLNLGAARFNQRDYSRAIQALRRGLELKPDESMAWARLAFCEARLKRWEDALHHYRIALRWNPMNALWWQEFGEACHDAGDAKGYAESLERLERLNPGLAKELGAYAKKHRIN